MYDERQAKGRSRAHLDAALIETLAEDVLASLVSQNMSDGRTEIVPVLCKTFMSDDPDLRKNIISRLNGMGISSEEFVTSFAGAAARHIGEQWANNEVSFADVTIVVARIQEAVRAFTSRKIAQTTLAPSPRILLLAPKQENHLLGLFVVADAFEELGGHVFLSIGHDRREVLALIKKNRFDFVGISVGSSRMVGEAKSIIDAIRSGVSLHVPIVVGGALTDLNPSVLENLGADLVESDPRSVLEALNLRVAEPSSFSGASTISGVNGS